jgi:4-amino-4-deoxychorismate lyase
MSTWVDGQAATTIDVRNRGLHYGDGCFETMLVVDGRLRSVTRHLARLQRGLQVLGITAPDFVWLQAQLQVAAASESGPGIVKLIVTRGSAMARGYKPQVGERATVIISRHAWSPPPATLQVEISGVSMGHNRLLAGIKHLNRLEQVMAQQQLGPECDEVIMQDQAGHAICGSMTNLFIVTASGLLTPRLDLCGVAGIMRSLAMDGARALSIPIAEADVPLPQLLAAPGLWLCNVRLGVRAVTRLAGRELAVDQRLEAVRHWIDAHGD